MRRHPYRKPYRAPKTDHVPWNPEREQRRFRKILNRLKHRLAMQAHQQFWRAQNQIDNEPEVGGEA